MVGWSRAESRARRSSAARKCRARRAGPDHRSTSGSTPTCSTSYSAPSRWRSWDGSRWPCWPWCLWRSAPGAPGAALDSGPGTTSADDLDLELSESGGWTFPARLTPPCPIPSTPSRRAGPVPPTGARTRCSPSQHPTWVSRHPDSPPGTSTRCATIVWALSRGSSAARGPPADRMLGVHREVTRVDPGSQDAGQRRGWARALLGEGEPRPDQRGPVVRGSATSSRLRDVITR